MNNKAQGQGVIAWVFMILIFMLIWFGGLGKWINDMADMSVQGGNLTGITAFLMANLNLWIFVALLLTTMAIMYLSR